MEEWGWRRVVRPLGSSRVLPRMALLAFCSEEGAASSKGKRKGRP